MTTYHPPTRFLAFSRLLAIIQPATNLKLLDGRLTALTALLLALGIGYTTLNPHPNWPPIRLVTAIISLATAAQVAFLLAPDGDAMLELLSTYPRSLPRLLWERWLALMAVQLILALTGTAASLILTNGNWTAAILHWLPPTLFFSGLILLVVQITRQSTLGVLVALMLWLSLLVGGDAMVNRWPPLQPIHAFLQPAHATPGEYTANRLFLTLFGLSVTALAASLLADPERALGWRPPLSWRGRLRQLPAALITLLLISYVGSLYYWVDNTARRSNAPVCCLTPADLGYDYETVQLASSDSVTLAGWNIPSQNGAAVILLHGSSGHRAMMLPSAQMLARHGYGVLLYDLRGHGESSGGRSFGWADTADVTTAVHFLQNRPDVDPDRIGLFGFSLGGQIALRAAAANPAIHAVAADGPGFANRQDVPKPTNRQERWLAFNDPILFQLLQWRTGITAPAAIVDTIAQIAPRPLLLIATGPANGPEQRLTQRYFEQAAEPKTLWLLPTTTHGRAPTTHPAEYEAQLITFFTTALSNE